MKQTSIVLCDSDEEYLHAFSSYLLDHISWLNMVSYSCQEKFLEDDREYEIGIMTEEFLQVSEFSGKENVKNKFYLRDDTVLEEYRHLPMVYKYQSMDVVIEMLNKQRQRQSACNVSQYSFPSSQIYGIYSPISHELQLPFALSLCQALQKQGRVLFLDFEELSILPHLLGREWDRNLLDVLYVMEGSNRNSLPEYISQFMGIDYIPPFGNPEDINQITEQQWKDFFRVLGELSYDSVVILFGRTIPGFHEMMLSCREMLVLNKPGDFYQKSQKSFLEYARNAGMEDSLSPVQLPMSAGNLTDGAYLLEELLQGNLGVYVRRQIEDGIILRETAAHGGK